MKSDKEMTESKYSTKDERLFDKQEEKLLKQLDYYHGFLPREDVTVVIKNEGEFLLRVSEVDIPGEPGKVRREIILSVFASSEGGEESVMSSVMESQDPKQKAKIRNMIVRRAGLRYFLDSSKVFDQLKEMVDYYATNVGSLNRFQFTLRTPIKLQKWEFLHSDVRLGKLLGEGAFGEVRTGVLKRKGKDIDVAIKLTKGVGDLGKAKIKEMMKEARLMRDLKHKNVVRIYGIGVQEQPLYIILELVKGGALNSYLKKHAGQVDMKEKIMMCLGAAQGVEYLHKHYCIHRDLAARNCLYSEDKVIKISDFGLSRLGTNYVIKSAVKLPIKWLAPETIQSMIFTHKTDVYSFGVMLFEVFADGGEPWDDFSNAEVKKALIEGKTLSLAEECPEKIRTFVKTRIFSKDPDERATMPEVVRFFESNSVDTMSDDKDRRSNATMRKSIMGEVTKSTYRSTSMMGKLDDNDKEKEKEKVKQHSSKRKRKRFGKEKERGFHAK